MLFGILLLNYISYVVSTGEVCFSLTQDDKENVLCKGNLSNIFEQIIVGRYKTKIKSQGIIVKGT